MRSVSRGLTMVEIVLTLGILAVAALGLIAAMTRLLTAQSSSSHQTVARIIVEAELEKACLIGHPDFGPEGSLGTTQSVEASVGQNASLTTFYYQTEAEEVLPSAALGIGAGTAATMGKMYRVKVRIWWDSDETGPKAAVERGRRELEVARVMYQDQ